MTVSIRRMSLGSGFAYLMNSVARGDGAVPGSAPLTRYYLESGTPPGQFIGAGLAGLNGGQGIAQGTEVSEEALRGFYRACDVFVAPSRFESFGLILLEAMMFAKPVVCCRAGGMPEVVVEGETSLLAEPGDAASLECALERLIEDPALRQRLGAAGRRRYEAHFTPEHMASDVAAFLCRSASVHRPGTPQSQAAAE